MSLEHVYITPDVIAACYLHANSTEKEEIIGLLLGEIVPMDDSFFEELGTLESCGVGNSAASSRIAPISTSTLSMVTVPSKGTYRYFGNSTLGEGYGGVERAAAAVAPGTRRAKYAGPTVARVWAMRAIPRIGDRRNDRVEVSDEIYRAALEAERCSEEFGRHTRVVGWYHSHPHITPYPSHVDLATQFSYQGMENGWVGLIFSVFPNANTPSSVPRLPAALAKQMALTKPATNSGSISPMRSAVPTDLHHSKPDVGRVPSTRTDPLAATIEPHPSLVGETKLCDDAEEEVNDGRSCGSFVMADHDAMGSSFDNAEREPSAEVIPKTTQEGDASNQVAGPAPTPKTTRPTPPEMFFGSLEFALSSMRGLDQPATAFTNSSATLSTPPPLQPQIRRLPTGGSNQFGTPCISLHCFQSSAPSPGNPHGHRKVPIVTTPLEHMPLAPECRPRSMAAMHPEAPATVASSLSLLPHFHNEALRVLHTLCEESDTGRASALASAKTSRIRDVIHASIEMQVMQRDAIVTNCLRSVISDLHIPMLQRALAELQVLDGELQSAS